MSTYSLSAENILDHMAEALPSHAKDDTTSDLCSSYEAIALFCHACMIAREFRLLGFEEGQRPENEKDECSRLAPRLPPKWNETFNSHTFLYAHKQSSMRYVIKVDRLGSKAEVRGIGLGDERICRFDITARDYVSSSALPLRITFGSNGEENRSKVKEDLRNIFISSFRIQDLASIFNLAIIKKLVPNLGKDHEESQNTIQVANREADSEREGTQVHNGPHCVQPIVPRGFVPVHPYSVEDPLAIQPNRQFPQGDFPPPNFDDDYDLLRNNLPRHPQHPPSHSPFNIGHDDLYPPGLGPHDPLRGGFPSGRGNRGMYPSFDDPLFGDGFDQGRVPRRPGVPQGARYDPIGPGDGPLSNRGPSNPFDRFRDGDII